MKKRNIVLCIVLTIVTGCIYGIYWMIKLNDCANELAEPEKKRSGVSVVLLTLVTCGIYGIYWAYKMGGLIDQARARHNLPAENRAVVYAVLQVIGLGIVGWALMQNSMNPMLPDVG